MKLHAMILSVILALPTFASSDKKFNVSPAGYRAVAENYNNEDLMRAFNHTPSLNLVFLIVANSEIEKINFSNSRVLSATDDTGRDLLKHGTKDKNDKANRKQFWSAPPHISDDGLACLLQTSIFSPLSLPSKKASKIILKAEVEIVTKKGKSKIPVELTYTLGL